MLKIRYLKKTLEISVIFIPFYNKNLLLKIFSKEFQFLVLFLPLTIPTVSPTCQFTVEN
jgi:hypothetical protein